MDDRIVTAKDLIKRDRKPTYSAWIKWMCHLPETKRKFGEGWKPFNGIVDFNNPVYARIDSGRWIADCECGGAMYVDPDEPIFFCLSCGNDSYNGKARVVIFPAEREDIEAAILRRPVKSHGRDPMTRALHAKEEIPNLGRFYNYGETVAQLLDQEEKCKKRFEREKEKAEKK